MGAMTPTDNNLREVGLRPDPRPKVCVDKSGNMWIFPYTIGKRTLGEYWRRERLLADARKFYECIPSMTQEEIHKAALRDCRERRWKSWLR